MRPEQIKTEVDKLSLSEKLALVADIWDSIAADDHPVPPPEWQKRELDRRYKEYLENPTELYDWEEVHAALRDDQRETKRQRTTARE